ncbi:integrase core domain-containing protein, partial [Rhodobacter capsulatus]|uniref:integrase core domain-containing protein n=1 Tax=Rhodobacter capsulatus TaxID=1061 RepID=UPI00056B3356
RSSFEANTNIIARSRAKFASDRIRFRSHLGLSDHPPFFIDNTNAGQFQRHVQPSIKPSHLPSSLAMIAAGKKAPAEPGAKSRLRHLNEEIFDSLADARRILALWRYDYNHVRPHSSLGNQTPAEARRALEQSETDHYQTQGLSL